jgi:beta-lactamase regulating signal transducer with metallopeptidase domain
MSLLFIKQWFSDETLQALCWTLIHSLWQGLLAAVAAGIIIISTKRSSASLRYNLLGSVLLLFLLVVVCTFTVQLRHPWNVPQTNVSGISNTDALAANPIIGAVAPRSTMQTINVIDPLVIYFNRHAALFVLLWAIFFMVKCLRLFTGLHYVHRIRTHKTHEPEKQWKHRVAQLSDMLGIKQSIRLLESELVKVPVAIGYLKPVILLPFGLLANLPYDQAETILLHELAHIRRKDYVVNLLQSILKAIFFFNPAVIWISSLIDNEREACCDDIVIANTERTGSYVEALVAFHEYEPGISPYAMALGGRQTPLLNRIKRMLTHENKKLNRLEKIVILAGLLLVMAFTFIPSHTPSVKKYHSNMPKPIIAQVQRQPLHKAIALKKDQKKSSKSRPAVIHMADTTPVPATVRLAKTPAFSHNYDTLSFTHIRFFPSNDNETREQTITATDKQGRVYIIEKKDGQVSGLSVEGVAIPAQEISNYITLMQKIFTTIEEAVARKRFNLRNRSLAAKDSPLADKVPTDKSKIIAPGNPANNKAKKAIPAFDHNNFAKDAARVRGVIADLVSQKFVQDAAAVDYFELSENELVVNDKKLPDEFHLAMMEKYGIRHSYGLFYGPCKKGGKGIIFEKGDLK